MATISVGAGNYARPYRNVRIRHFPEGASQTFKRGELLILILTADKGNKVGIASADPTTDRAVVGFAAADASGVEGTMIPVWLATPEAEFVLHCESAGTIDNDDVSVQYGVVRDGTNVIWRVDRTESTAKLFTVLQLLDAHGDVNGRFVVKFINSEILHG